jgi:hypothetical protein
MLLEQHLNRWLIFYIVGIYEQHRMSMCEYGFSAVSFIRLLISDGRFHITFLVSLCYCFSSFIILYICFFLHPYLSIIVVHIKSVVSCCKILKLIVNNLTDP